MAQAAIPAAMTAGKVAVPLLGGLLSKQFSKPPALTPEGQRAQQGLLSGANSLTAMGQSLAGEGADTRRAGMRGYQLGGSDLNAVSSYLRAITSGGAGAATAAMAPQIGQITSAYRGARSGLDRSGLTGASRDMADAELGRSRAEQISGLILNTRPQAVGQLAQIAQGRQAAGLNLFGMGTNLGQAGVAATGAAQGPLSTLYGGEMQRAKQGADNGAIFGKLFGDILFDLLKGGKGGGGASMPGGSLWSTYAPSLVPNRP